MNITFRQLRVFTEVAELGSMARAAETLHLTPPAVSMQIKEVESQVGLPLFDRHGRAVSLSTAGEYFLVHAKRLLAALKEADDAMARLKRVERGLLTIGMVSTAKYFVPHLLARFHEDHPGIDVRLRVLGNREQLVAQMHTGEVNGLGLPQHRRCHVVERAGRAAGGDPHVLEVVEGPGMVVEERQRPRMTYRVRRRLRRQRQVEPRKGHAPELLQQRQVREPLRLVLPEVTGDADPERRPRHAGHGDLDALDGVTGRPEVGLDPLQHDLEPTTDAPPIRLDRGDPHADTPGLVATSR